jgi:hypothetical protein
MINKRETYSTQFNDVVEFKGFNRNGDLQSHTWASAPITIKMEREVYEKLLRDGYYARVMVCEKGQWNEL